MINKLQYFDRSYLKIVESYERVLIPVLVFLFARFYKELLTHIISGTLWSLIHEIRYIWYIS
ncbi:MAG: hypothetical protein L0I12_07955, partial [Lactococcus sp.]|nr:hypothetical protein [Lactococcus sp.]